MDASRPVGRAAPATPSVPHGRRNGDLPTHPFHPYLGALVYCVYMRIIAHLDMDAFFAGIEERRHPRLAGAPIVVGADPLNGRGRGVVSTASYAARAYGIRSALPIGRAWRLAEAARAKGLPPAAFLEVDMPHYAEVSRRVMAILRRHVKEVEEASVDEAFLDLSSVAADPWARAEGVAREIKAAILREEGLTASVGIGPNKLVAKIASDREKPDGLTLVRGEEAADFLAPLPVRAIPGVGPKTEARLAALGARAVGDARRFSGDELRKLFGKGGADLYEKLRGRDEAPLVLAWEAKSVGEQETFALDARDPKFLRARLAAIADGVLARVKEGGFRSFRGVALTVRFADFTTVSRATTFDQPIPADGSPAAREAMQFAVLRLFMPFLDRRMNPDRKAVRLVGLRAEKLA